MLAEAGRLGLVSGFRPIAGPDARAQAARIVDGVSL